MSSMPHWLFTEKISSKSVHDILRDALHGEVFAVVRCPSVRLSVRLSHAGIVYKRLKLYKMLS